MKNLVSLRKANNLKQSDVAEAIGVSTAAYGFYETGRREASYETLHALARFFNTSVDFLLGRTDINIPLTEWTPDEIAQGVGNHAVVLSDEDSYRLDVLARAEETLGKPYVDGVIQLLEFNIQSTKKDKKS